MEAPPSTLNNLNTHRANKPTVHDPVVRMTSNSRRIERETTFFQGVKAFNFANRRLWLIKSKAFDKSTATFMADSLLSRLLLQSSVIFRRAVKHEWFFRNPERFSDLCEIFAAEISPRFINLGGQNPAENPAEIHKSRRDLG